MPTRNLGFVLDTGALIALEKPAGANASKRSPCR